MDNKINIIIEKYFKDANFKKINEYGGEINKILILDINGKEYALRYRPTSQDKNDLKFEYEFLKELNKHDLEVEIPKIILTENGNYYTEHEGYTYSLLTKVSGEQIFPNWHDSHLHTETHLISGFKLLAKLHNAYRKINIPDYKNSQSELDLLNRFKETILNINQMPQGEFKQVVADKKYIILDKIQKTEEGLKEKEYNNYPKFPTHYDLNFTNVLWKGDEISSIIDFDWAQYATLEFDFCQACKLTGGLFSINGHLNEFIENRLKLALKTYNKHSEIPLEDPEILALLLDVSSLFLLNWSIEFFKKNPEKEKYFINFFHAGLDRISQSDLSKFFT